VDEGANPDHEPLPRLYRRWLDRLLGAPLRREKKANCSQCPMCRAGDTAALEVYRPDVKCCTYTPKLPNFLVGSVLSDAATDERTRAVLTARIEDASSASPLGLRAAPLYRLVYEAAKAQGFGKLESLACPYLTISATGGQCGVWNHRNSACSTWFCKHIDGPHGAAVWREVESLLRRVESLLSLWACFRLGLSARTLAELRAEVEADSAARVTGELLGTWEANTAKLWSDWSGDKLGFYRESFALIDALSWADVLALGGAELSVQAEALAALVQAQRGHPPSGLQLGSFRIQPAGSGTFILVTYSRTDCVAVTRAELAALATTPDDSSRVEEHLRRSMSPEKLAALISIGVLITRERQAYSPQSLHGGML